MKLRRLACALLAMLLTLGAFCRAEPVETPDPAAEEAAWADLPDGDAPQSEEPAPEDPAPEGEPPRDPVSQDGFSPDPDPIPEDEFSLDPDPVPEYGFSPDPDPVWEDESPLDQPPVPEDAPGDPEPTDAVEAPEAAQSEPIPEAPAAGKETVAENPADAEASPAHAETADAEGSPSLAETADAESSPALAEVEAAAMAAMTAPTEDAVPSGEAPAEASPETASEAAPQEPPTSPVSEAAAPPPVAVGLAVPSVTLRVGEVYAPQVVTEPADADKTVTLSTKNRRTVSVANGVVTAKRKGKAKVTVRTANGLKAKLTVQVVGPAKRIHMNQHYYRIASGESVALSCTLYGGKSSYAFETSDPGVAQVDPATGVVTGVGTGSAVITARTDNGKTAACQVNVNTDGYAAPAGQLEVTFMNIGHNDGILLCCDGEYAFIDSGEHPQGVRARRFLRSRGIYRLKYYIGTHGHEDHLGGAPVLLEALDVETVIVPHKRCVRWIKGWAHGSAERTAARAANYHIMRPGEVITLGGASLTCLGPVHVIKAGTEEGGPENRNSLVLRLVHGENSILLTGDALGGELVDIQRRSPGSMRATVLKNPHHDKPSQYAVKRANPQIVVICTSSDQPAPANYVKWLRHRGCKVYITASNRHGRVTMYSDGAKLDVVTQYPRNP